MSGMDNWRNRLAARLCSWVLVHVADDSYERYIGGAIRYGMRAAVKDEVAARAEGDGRTDHLPGTPCPEHRPVQHRDGKTPWCSLCGLTKEGLRPVSKLDNARRPGRADR